MHLCHDHAAEFSTSAAGRAEDRVRRLKASVMCMQAGKGSCLLFFFDGAAPFILARRNKFFSVVTAVAVDQCLTV